MMKVALNTNFGRIVLELDEVKAPKTVANFVEYVKSGHYNGVIFHRVIKDFMIRGGGFDKNMSQKPTKAPIQNEADNGLLNKRGTLAMARTNVPDSATAQFFINYKDNSFLNYTSSTASGWGYAVFAEVVEGMDIVDEMAKQPTGNRDGHQDVPKTDIIVEKAEVID